MRVYVVSKEVIYNADAEDSSDLTTNIKVFQELKDAIAFVKSYDYFADDQAIDHMALMGSDELAMFPDFWTAEDGLLVLCVTSDFKTKSDATIRYTLYIEEMELE